jgi:dienelactone hydrolase
VKAKIVSYEADGLHMLSRLVWDSKARERRPGVVLFPHAFGLDDHAKHHSERLVHDFGYVALAADLHGNGEVISELDKVMPRVQAFRTDAARVRARTRAAFEALKARPEVDPGRIAAIGFCMGGTMAFELALSGVDLKAAVGFHSGLTVTSPQDAKQIKGKILALIGADDPGVPPESRNAFGAAMREGGVDWQMHLFGGVVHSFTDANAGRLNRPEALRYDPRASARAWKLMGDLFRETFG